MPRESILLRHSGMSSSIDARDRLVMAVYDIDAARGELLSQGVEVSEVSSDFGSRSLPTRRS